MITHVLNKALPKVATNGWTQALTLGIRECGLSDQAVSIFPNGSLSLVEFWLDKCIIDLKDVPLDGSQQDKIKQLLAARLQLNSQIGPFLPDAQALLLRSPLTGAAHLGKLSDEIWWLAGDQSTDSVWYTRRGSLGAIYAAAETFQTMDTSKEFRDTVKFAASKVDSLASAEYAASSFSEWAKFNSIATFNVFKSLCT